MTEKIYLHSLFDKNIVLVLFLNPWLLKKCKWIIWGGDLYRYRQERKTLKSKLYEIARRKIIRNMGELLPLVKGDYDLARKWYGTKAKYKYTAIYIDPRMSNYLNEAYNKERMPNGIVKILVGNSATATNNHKEVFDYLKRFKEENIIIYCPLSYGDMDYSKEIIEYGSEIFGYKFKAITNFMDFNEYMGLLNTMDIGIFNNDRQQALGNIRALLLFGKKVYMKENTTMWDEHMPEFKIYSIKSIKFDSFDEFTNYRIETKERNQAMAKGLFDIGQGVQVWQKIFKS